MEINHACVKQPDEEHRDPRRRSLARMLPSVPVTVTLVLASFGPALGHTVSYTTRGNWIRGMRLR